MIVFYEDAGYLSLLTRGQKRKTAPPTNEEIETIWGKGLSHSEGPVKSEMLLDVFPFSCFSTVVTQ